MPNELVMFTRTFGCSYVSIARSVLSRLDVGYREINIDNDSRAKQNLQSWVGYLSVPTLFLAEPGQDMPYTPPESLPAGKSPRGIDRGSMITEPNAEQLSEWLGRNGLLER